MGNKLGVIISYPGHDRCMTVPKLNRRLDRLLEDRDISMKQLSVRSGLSETAVRDILKRKTSPRVGTLSAIASTLNVSVAYLIGEVDFPDVDETGEIPLRWDGSDISKTSDLPAIHSGHLGPGHLDIDDVEYASIGRFDAGLSAGKGSLIEVDPEPLGYQLFEAQWLKTVSTALPADLAVVRVDGDSMERTFNDGDWVLVDLSQRKFEYEGVYALRVGDAAWIKRIALNLSDKLIQIISDNSLYPIRQVKEDDINLIGRVVCIVARKV